MGLLAGCSFIIVVGRVSVPCSVLPVAAKHSGSGCWQQECYQADLNLPRLRSATAAAATASAAAAAAGHHLCVPISGWGGQGGEDRPHQGSSSNSSVTA
jgi:hypothetical protein